MAQNFYSLDVTKDVKTVIPQMQTSLESVASNFSGESFPTDNLFIGMKCYRTDLKNTYKWDGTDWLLDSPSFATDDEAKAGTVDDKIMSPARVKTAISNVKGVAKGLATLDENGYVVQKSNIAISAEGITNETLRTIILAVYPVGCFYWSSISTNPAVLFGGTWEQVKDKFVLAAGDIYKSGDTAGEASHILTEDEIPSHNHLVKGTTSNAGAHTHSVYGSNSGTNNRQEGMDTEGNAKMNNEIAYTTSSAGDHSHSFSVTSENTGGGKTHNNMPPYVVAYCWKRTA